MTEFWEFNAMNLLRRFAQCAALGALLLGLGFAAASADEIQDANKLFKQGQPAQALEKVEAFLAQNPKDATARFLKGLIKTEQGKADEAIRIFTALTEDYPELPEPYNNLAVLYAGQGQYEQAKTALEMAIRTHPSYATAYENLGDIYAKMASQAYERALQLAPNSTTPQGKLALIRQLFSAAPASAAHATPSSPIAASAPAATVPPAAEAAAPVAASAGKPAGPAGISEEIIRTVHDWADAWSSNNVPKFLAFYAKEFKVPNGESRSSWEKQRYRLIAKPKSIQVSIAAATVRVADDSHAAVTFRQSYRSGTLKTSTVKTLEMVKLDGTWKILEERTGN